jgi:hypothetical protein
MTDLIIIDQDAKENNTEVRNNNTFLIAGLLKDFNEAETVTQRIELAKTINNMYNTAINATQVAINGLKEQRLTQEFQIKFSGLAPLDK